MNFKKIIKFLIFFLPWFLSSFLLLGDNQNYYQSLNLPMIAPPALVFIIIWPILYFLIAYSIYLVFDKNNHDYVITLAINYLLNQLFAVSFFFLQSLFLSFINTLMVFISSLFLYYETKIINKKASNLLIPYLMWGLFALILSLTIFFKNI